MAQKEIVWHISDAMYNEMTQAQRELSFPSLMDLLTLAVQRYLAEVQHEKWQQQFRQLQQDVRASGGFHLGLTKEEVIKKLREQRRQLFESDYADMY
ncbi:hypothetical protein [Candidatus Electronema sp. TJ]|uniref:hypothetical protein n=1 Tax=Candidatus Electronema sp. TJ TaxID=3401573 RepID=UPI003AA816A4